MNSVRGDISIGRYLYVTCVSEFVDTVGDVRVYSVNGRLISERCVVGSAQKGLGTWVFSNHIYYQNTAPDIATSYMGDVWVRISDMKEFRLTPADGPFQKSLIKYGKLYAYNDIDFTKEFILGMSVPETAELEQLVNYVISTFPEATPSNIGSSLKSVRTEPADHPRWSTHWDGVGTDLCNFSILPSGAFKFGLMYSGLGMESSLLSKTNHGSSAKSFITYWNMSIGVFSDIEKTENVGVRCVRAASLLEQGSEDGSIVGRVKDFDNNDYDLVKIGLQVWTRQNIAATKYIDGTAVTAYDYNNNSTNTFFAEESDSIWIDMYEPKKYWIETTSPKINL